MTEGPDLVQLKELKLSKEIFFTVNK